MVPAVNNSFSIVIVFECLYSLLEYKIEYINIQAAGRRKLINKENQ